MSGHPQRTKGKPVQRIRNQRLPTQFVKAQGNGTKVEENLGIFANYEFTYVVGRHIIGNIGEITTTDDEKVHGLIKAISPSGDMGLTYAYASQNCTKNGKINVTERVIPFSNIKMVHISNVKLNDCLIDDMKADAEIQNDCITTGSPTASKPLVPFFAPSDALQDCVLDQGGFPAEEMFKTNEQLFSVSTTYNPDLREYTTPVDRNAPDYSETEARCAKLAMEFERDQSPHTNIDDACDHALEDEEEKYSAVSRNIPKDTSYSSRYSSRYSRGSNDKTNFAAPDSLQSANKRSVQGLIHGAKPLSLDRDIEASQVSSTTDVVSKSETVGNQASDASPQVCQPSAEHPANLSVTVSAEAASDVGSIPTEEKVKRSTLDPNAPEFQPSSFQYGVFNSASQVPQQISVPIPAYNVPHLAQAYTAPLNSTQPNHYPIQTLPAILSSGQPQMYAASAVQYGSQAGHIQQMVGSAIPSGVQHMRTGSLPPALQQQNFAPNASFLWHAQQSGLPTHLLNPSSVIVAGGNHMRYPAPPSGLGLPRQRSNEQTSTPHSSAYGQQQPNVSAPAFQTPTVYQMSQAGAIPLFVPGHPQMGLHFVSAGVPGAVSSSALMMGGIGIPQTAGQQAYPAHAMYPMQPAHIQIPNVQLEQTPPQSSTSQQSHTQQSYASQLAHMHESQNIPFPVHPHAMMFAGQAGAPAYYATGPAVLPGPGAMNPAMQSGFIPMVNQSNHNTMSGNVPHPAQLDPSLANAQQAPQPQFPQANCQPQWMPQNPYQAYQALAALVASGGNPPVQPH